MPSKSTKRRIREENEAKTKANSTSTSTPTQTNGNTPSVPSTPQTKMAGEEEAEKEKVEREVAARIRRDLATKIRWSAGREKAATLDPPSTLEEAYKTLGIQPGLTDEELWTKICRVRSLSSMTSPETVVVHLDPLNPGLTNLNPNLKKERFLGSLLLISCSRATSRNNFYWYAQELYIIEANHRLKKIRLPLPMCSESQHAQIGPPRKATAKPTVDRATQMSDVVEKKKPTPEEEAIKKQLKGEIEKIKSETAMMKAEVKESFTAKAEREREREALEKKLKELKENKENDALVPLENGRVSPSPSIVDAPFAIKALSAKVLSLNRQIEAKDLEIKQLRLRGRRVLQA